MWTIDSKEAWYAIFVVVGQEEKVKYKLQNKFEEI